jgi:hypothetical protein
LNSYNLFFCCLFSVAKIANIFVKSNGFWRINVIQPKIKAKPTHNDRHGASHHMAMNNSLDYYVDKLKTIVKK